MALFSRRKKSDSPASAQSSASAASPASTDDVADAVGPDTSAPVAPESGAADAADAAPSAEVPAVGISVQAFRGVGAAAGPAVSLPSDDAPATARTGVSGGAPASGSAPASNGAVPQAPAGPPALPLAPAMPPEQKHTVNGLNDNVLLREALARVPENPTNEQLLGVLRQTLQGHLYLRVSGDARQQISEGKPLSVGIVRDGDRSFMLAYSSGAALRDSFQKDENPAETSAIAQPVLAVYRQVVGGDFAGIIIDNSSAPHRAVFPSELLAKAVEQSDDELELKTLLAAPREADSAARIGEVLAKKRVWVAVSTGQSGQAVGIAEARTPDGTRYLQVFSHPLEVVVLGRGDQAMPFQPEQLAKLLSEHTDIAGVLVDSGGPSIALDREALAPVLVLAVNTDTES